MTITFNLSPALAEKVQVQAAASGKSVETYVREAVEDKLLEKKHSLFRILKPLHDEVELSGISEEELDALIERELAAVRAEKKQVRVGSPTLA